MTDPTCNTHGACTGRAVRIKLPRRCPSPSGTARLPSARRGSKSSPRRAKNQVSQARGERVSTNDTEARACVEDINNNTHTVGGLGRTRAHSGEPPAHTAQPPPAGTTNAIRYSYLQVKSRRLLLPPARESHASETFLVLLRVLSSIPPIQRSFLEVESRNSEHLLTVQ